MGAGWIATGALAMAMVAGVVAAEPVAPASFTLRLDDRARIPTHDLDAAKAEMARVFHAAGIEIAWVEGRFRPEPGHATLFLLDAEFQPSADGGDVAGLAVRETSSAFVYRNRLDALTSRLSVDANVILGRVMAHELGHLLLPPNSHSRFGVMRPQMDLSQITVNRFTNEQVAALHRAVGM